MTRRPPQSTRTDTPLPSPTLFRSDDIGAAGTEDIVVRIFDAQGNVVGGFDIDESGFWNLGDDTTDPIAVNVVYEGDRSVDTFAANVTQEDLAGLTDPDLHGTPNLAGAPAGFGPDLRTLNFHR